MSKRIDASEVSPTIRRDENMRLQTPRVIQPPVGLFGAEYTDSIDPERTNPAFLADDAFLPRARTRERTPLYHDPGQIEARENVLRGAFLREDELPRDIQHRPREQPPIPIPDEAVRQLMARHEDELRAIGFMPIDHNVLAHARLRRRLAPIARDVARRLRRQAPE